MRKSKEGIFRTFHLRPRRSLFISPSCLQSCADPPHAFTTWMAPLAWVVAEFGMSDFLRAEILPAVPILDTAPFALEMEKMAVALRDDKNVVLHRVCAVLTAYRLVPMAILALLLVLALYARSYVLQRCCAARLLSAAANIVAKRRLRLTMA